MNRALSVTLSLLLLLSFSGCKSTDGQPKEQMPHMAAAREEVLPLVEYCFQKDGIEAYTLDCWKFGKCTEDSYVAVIVYKDAEENLQSYPFFLKNTEKGMVVTDYGPKLEVPKYTILFAEEITPEIFPDATAVAG